MFPPSRRGYSLIEVVLAASLLTVVGLILASLIRGGLRSSEVGRITVDAQNSGRVAIKRLCEDLAAATRLTSMDADMPSGVVRPSTVYPYACNELYLIAPSLSSAKSLANVSSTANYSLVRYRVCAANGAAGTNTLRREVFSLGAADVTALFPKNGSEPSRALPALINGVENHQTNESSTCMHESVLYRRGLGVVTPGGNITAYTLPAVTNRQAFWVDETKLPANASAQNIVELAGTNDIVQFVVSHKKLTQISDDKYNTVGSTCVEFERSTFFVDVWIRRFYHDDRTQPPIFKQFSETVVVSDTGG